MMPAETICMHFLSSFGSSSSIIFLHLFDFLHFESFELT